MFELRDHIKCDLSASPSAGMMSAIVEYNVGKNVMVQMEVKMQGTITEAKQSEEQVRHLGLGLRFGLEY